MTPATTEKPLDLDHAFEAARERELREFVRRDGASVRRTPETDGEPVANNIGTLFERVAGTSVQEIDDLIAGLRTLRSLLQDQGARVQRELAEYAHLSQSAMESTKIIAEGLVQWGTRIRRSRRRCGRAAGLRALSSAAYDPEPTWRGIVGCAKSRAKISPHAKWPARSPPSRGQALRTRYAP